MSVNECVLGIEPKRAIEARWTDRFIAEVDTVGVDTASVRAPLRSTGRTLCTTTLSTIWKFNDDGQSSLRSRRHVIKLGSHSTGRTPDFQCRLTASISRAPDRRQICACKFDDWLGRRLHAVVRRHQLDRPEARLICARRAKLTRRSFDEHVLGHVRCCRTSTQSHASTACFRRAHSNEAFGLRSLGASSKTHQQLPQASHVIRYATDRSELHRVEYRSTARHSSEVRPDRVADACIDDRVHVDDRRPAARPRATSNRHLSATSMQVVRRIAELEALGQPIRMMPTRRESLGSLQPCRRLDSSATPRPCRLTASISRAPDRRQICVCKFDDWLGRRLHAVVRRHAPSPRFAGTGRGHQ